MRQAFLQLSSALQSGDLSAAQNAYATITQLGGDNGNGPFAQTLSQIGSALQSGDVGKAQQAMAQLKQHMQAMRGHHHHHHKSDAQAQNDSNQASAGNTSFSSIPAGNNLVDVTT